MCSFHLCQTLLQILSYYHMFPHIKSTTPFPPPPPTQKQVPFLPKHLILLKHSCTRCGKGSFSHYLQGFSTIPSGDRRISEPSTVSYPFTYMNGWFSWQVFWEIWPVPWILVDSLFSYPHLLFSRFLVKHAWWRVPPQRFAPAPATQWIHWRPRWFWTWRETSTAQVPLPRGQGPGDSQPTPNKIGDVGNENKKSLFFLRRCWWFGTRFFGVCFCCYILVMWIQLFGATVCTVSAAHVHL